jgi:hypothetical protein
MPLLTAQKHQWTKQPPYNFYHFPDEHLVGWQKFWEEMDGDLDKILAFAEKASIECPCEWFESLHRFLFGTFAGDVKLLKTAAEKDFKAFLKQTAENHQKEPLSKEWYTVKGITQNNFIAMLERAAEITDVRQAVAFVNSRIRDLGFFLYSAYILSKTKGKSEVKALASDLNKKAYVLETDAIGESPINGITAGLTVTHALFPGDFFMITEVLRTASDEIETLVTRDPRGHIAFINDVWNVQVV